MDENSVRISAVWLRRVGDRAQVLIQVAGEWRLVIEEPEPLDAVGRIVEAGEIANPPDKPSGSGEKAASGA